MKRDKKLESDVQSVALRMIADDTAPTEEKIRQAVKGAVDLCADLNGEHIRAVVDQDALVRRIESLVVIWQPEHSVLEETEGDHIPWLDEEHDDLAWSFWDRYRNHLEAAGLPPQVVRGLDGVTEDVLGRLESPRRPGPWDRRGLVVGHVQSGKTGNYTGLICKALDAGYRLVVVLAGVHESLRCQTQQRIEEGVLGHDARFARASADEMARKHRVGVGVGAFAVLLPVNSYTNREGDFTSGVARKVGPLVGADPVVLVVKKNKSVLENVINWARSSGNRDPETGRYRVRETPLLVIDDEADHASVNTKAMDYGVDPDGSDEVDPTTINRLIRELLELHDKSAYVGYTATPFANIFIREDEDHSTYGDDLFPKSFIVRISPPANYVGPARVFGLQAADEADDFTSVEPLDIVRDVLDEDGFIADPKRKDSGLGPPPPSLVEAIHSFILAGAIRAARGESAVHNSMLVHVTRFVMVQEHVATLLEGIVASIGERLRYGDAQSTSPIRTELRDLWERDFVPTRERLPIGDMGELVTWEAVDKELTGFVRRISIYRVNGTAQDALQYADHAKEGLAVIAVGGDKLARGLTLEGLTVSYYLRASRMYDTLMQMGRWFGFRTGYLDVCRLYTTRELQDWYSHIAMANEELNRRFDAMASQRRDPTQFGLLVRTHPDGLLITARTKMRNAHSMRLNFSETCPETTAFDLDPDVHKKNAELVTRFLEIASETSAPTQHPTRAGVWTWSGLASEAVVSLVESFSFAASARRVDAGLLGRFIRGAQEQGELTDWTVALVGRSPAEVDTYTRVAGLTVGLVTRAQRTRVSTRGRGAFSVKSVTSAPDELLDLDEQQVKAARAKTRERIEDGKLKRRDPSRLAPDGLSARAARKATQALLLLYPIEPRVKGRRDVSVDTQHPIFGLAISFPVTERTKPVNYSVNNVFWESEVRSA